VAGRRCADWRFPTPKQAKAEETARLMRAGAEVRNLGQEAGADPRTLHGDRLRTPSFDDPAPDAELPAGYWSAILEDPRAAGRPWLPVSQMRLSEIPRELLRVECLRCFRTVEIQRLDAIKLYGPHAVWKEVGNRLLDNGCQVRTGRHEEDGCWPDFK
jgi:hypothetical protein